MIGSTNSIFENQKQLINYKMLYYFGDECLENTGGWVHNYTQSNSTSYYSVSKNEDNIEINVIRGYSGTPTKVAVSTEKTFNASEFNKALIKWDVETKKNSYARCAVSSRKDIAVEPGVAYNAFSYGYLNEVASVSEVAVFDRALENTESLTNLYGQVNAQSNGTTSSASANLKMYAFAMLKKDDWQKLAQKAGITATYIDDILTNSATLLSNKEAVNFMLYNCTGDFMASAIHSEAFLSALNNSPFKTKILANEHWAKFLAFAS